MNVENLGGLSSEGTTPTLQQQPTSVSKALSFDGRS